MGRATIVSEIGEGAYTVDLDFDRTDADARITALTTQVAGAASTMSTKLTQLQQVLAVHATATANVIQAILDYQAALATGDEQTILNARHDLQTMQARLTDAEVQVARANGYYNQAVLLHAVYSRQLTTLQSQLVYGSPRVDVWCADYTTDIVPGTTVGTIEVGRRGSREAILRPGCKWDKDRDGLIHQTMSITPAAALHAWALLPGASRWRPRYRVGELTFVDTVGWAYADVQLDALTIVQRMTLRHTLDCNKTDSLASVPFDYMGTATPTNVFEVGDRVVVEFRDTGTPSFAWDNPVIIGFERNPRALAMTVTGPEVVYNAARYLIRGGELPYFISDSDGAPLATDPDGWVTVWSGGVAGLPYANSYVAFRVTLGGIGTELEVEAPFGSSGFNRASLGVFVTDSSTSPQTASPSPLYVPNLRLNGPVNDETFRTFSGGGVDGWQTVLRWTYIAGPFTAVRGLTWDYWYSDATGKLAYLVLWTTNTGVSPNLTRVWTYSANWSFVNNVTAATTAASLIAWGNQAWEYPPLPVP